MARQTLNPLAVATAALLQRLLWLMFGLYAGVAADRVSWRGRWTPVVLLAGAPIGMI